MKHIQEFNIECPVGKVILMPVPTLKDLERFKSKIILTEQAKINEERERQKVPSRPFVVCDVNYEDAVGNKIQGRLKKGDFVFSNPDMMSTATIVRFNPDVFYKNPLVVDEYFLIKVKYTEEYEKEFEEIISGFEEKLNANKDDK